MIRSTIATAAGRGGVDAALVKVEAEVRSRLGATPEAEKYLRDLLTEFRALYP